jgi:elongation factor P
MCADPGSTSGMRCTKGINPNRAGSWIPAFAGMTSKENMKASDIKRGNVIEYNGKVWQIRDIERSSPTARGGNVTFRFTMYSVPGGQKFDLSLRADDDLKETEVTRRAVSYSYMDGDNFVFMDIEDYTQYLLGRDSVGDAAGYITDGLEGCYMQLIEGQAVAVQLPPSVTLQVVDTAPELKGATATKRPKPARLNTGIEIQVPEYITVGEKILVSTVTGEFAGRA